MSMFQVIMVENGLALEVTTNGALIPTSRAKGDPYKVAKRLGITFQTGNGTKKARRMALADVVAFRTANDPGYTPGDYVTKALGQEDTDRAVAAGQSWVATGEALPFQ